MASKLPAPSQAEKPRIATAALIGLCVIGFPLACAVAVALGYFGWTSEGVGDVSVGGALVAGVAIVGVWASRDNRRLSNARRNLYLTGRILPLALMFCIQLVAQSAMYWARRQSHGAEFASDWMVIAFPCTICLLVNLNVFRYREPARENPTVAVMVSVALVAVAWLLALVIGSLLPA
jgi:hypothetical protein